MSRYVKITDGNGKVFTFGTKDDGGLTLESLHSSFPSATNVMFLTEKNEKVLMRIENGSIYPFGDWNSDVTYVAHFCESYPENNLNENKIDYIERLKEFMLYSILTKTESGSFENVSAIRSCVTVATKDYALMAAHCLPADIPEQFKFAIYNQDDKPHIVQIEYINKNLDFAVLKTVEKEFEKYPNGLAFPYTGIKYTLLGYHGYNYQASYFLSAFFGRIRNNQHSPQLEFVLGSPGTTRGCSGSGAFSHLSLIGIVVAGRISPQNVYSSNRSLSDHVSEACIELAEPSYSHIVPSSTIFALLEQHKLFRLYHPLSSPQAQSNQLTLEEAFQNAKV